MSETLHTGVDAATSVEAEAVSSAIETPTHLEAPVESGELDPVALNEEVLGEASIEAEADSPVDPKIDPEMAAEVEAETNAEAIEPASVPSDGNVPPQEETKAVPTAAAPAATVEEAKAEVEKPIEPAEPEESFADIFSEFQRTHARREEGSSQIRGTVVSVTDDSVLVDIGFKSEGILPLDGFCVV